MYCVYLLCIYEYAHIHISSHYATWGFFIYIFPSWFFPDNISLHNTILYLLSNVYQTNPIFEYLFKCTLYINMNYCTHLQIKSATKNFQNTKLGIVAPRIGQPLFILKNNFGLLRTRKTIENVITVLTFKRIRGERWFSVPPMFSILASRRRPVFEIPPSTLTPFTRYPCPENDNQFFICIPKIKP